MVESYVRTQIGASNEPWYASVTKVGHSNASLVLLRYENTVVTFLTSTLRNRNYTPRHMGSFLSGEEAQVCFWAMIGQVSEAVYTDPMFKVVHDLKNVRLSMPILDDMGSVQSRRVFNEILSHREIKDQLSYFATTTTNDYLHKFEAERYKPRKPPRQI